MAYRLYRRDPVVAGEWYFAVECKGCGKQIYVLDDKTNGKNTVQISGDVEVSTPCMRCGHEGLYPATTLKALQSTENLDGARPPRVPINNSSRKPLLRNFSNARATFGVGYIEDRPAAAAIVGRIITAWADIEIQCARLLAEIMGTNVPAAAAVFGSLRSSRAQHDALNAAAAVVLDAKDYELFSAHMARRSSLESERNDLAHGCFGVSVAIPDAVIWVSQSDYLNFTTARNHDQKAQERFREKQFVYELGTLERIAQEIEEFYTQLGFFTGYLLARRDGLPGDQFRAQRYPQLCSQSHIRQALVRIQAAKRASQSPQQGKSSRKKPRP